jgi:hypothetical protein
LEIRVKRESEYEEQDPLSTILTHNFPEFLELLQKLEEAHPVGLLK